MKAVFGCVYFQRGIGREGRGAIEKRREGRREGRGREGAGEEPARVRDGTPEKRQTFQGGGVDQGWGGGGGSRDGPS